MMKKTNKKSILAIVFAVIFVFTSMAAMFLPEQASAVGKRGKIRSVRVTSVKKLTTGKTSKIKVKVNPKKVTAKVTFKTSNKSIATVSRKGIVRAKKPGRVIITVKVKSKNTKIKKIKINVIPKKKASTKKKKKSASKNTTAKKDTTKKDNTSDGNNDDGNGEETPSSETALDKKTSADGVLTLSKSDLTYVSFFDAYYLPTNFTKAKTIVLPEGNYRIYEDDEVKANRTYVFNGQSYIYSGIKASSNQEVVNNLECDLKGTENSLYTPKIVGNGTSKVTLRNGRQITVVVKGYNPTNTLRYQCKKVVNEITNSSMSESKKTDVILDYIVDHRDSHYELNIGSYHMKTDCTGYSKVIAQMMNFAGIDCCMRLAGYDKFYGQTPTHQNNLACIDGVAYVIDEDIIIKYSELFDSKNRYIGYNTQYADDYPELNREGKLDYNLENSRIGYDLILKKAGRL